MQIDQVCPDVVGARDVLKRRLTLVAKSLNFSDAEINGILSLLPPNLASAGCFEDKVTGRWRYEFGEYLKLSKTKKCLWGTHMWVQVATLALALAVVGKRVPASKQAAYLARLDDRIKHLDVLFEMAPAVSVEPSAQSDFEISGSGIGNSTIDWSFCTSGGRSILVDVKSRVFDLIEHMDRINDDSAPTHDATKLFKSLEHKFLVANPDNKLQGVWIATHIKQERSKLVAAFEALDSQKVHFAIFGDWDPDVFILTRREADRPFLKWFFSVVESGRFVFD